MNDDQFFLANAYLDGELSAEERAVAESDPDVMSAVAELRAVQELVGGVEAASDATRDTAIAAAMTHFAPSVGTTATPVAARRPAVRYLAVAAGVLGVGLLGVAIANLGTSSGDDSAADEPTSEEPAAAEAPRFTEDAPADDAATEMMAEEPASEPAMDMADDSAMAPAEEPAEEPADEPAAAATESGPRPVLVPDQVLATPEELGSFGTGLLEQAESGTLPPTPNHSCPVENVLGRTDYLVDGAVTTLLVAVDEPALLVLGVDEDSCEFVVDGPLYLP